MIDYSLLEIIPADESHREFSYQVKKAAEGEYIAGIWGWNEDIQRDFHSKDWQQSRPDLITYDGKTIGTIHISEIEELIHIGQFLKLKNYFLVSLGKIKRI